MAERRFDENELAMILRAAATAQAEGTQSSADPAGFTLDDIKRLASEVGIEPTQIAIAAEQIENRPRRDRRFYFFGAPSTEVVDRSFEGQLDDESWQDLVSELRATFGSGGTVSSMGSTLEWKGGSDTTSAHLSATPRNGRTKYRMLINRSGGMMLGWAGGFVSMFVAELVLLIALNKAGAGLFELCMYTPFLLAAIYFPFRFVISKWAHRNDGAIDSLMDRFKKLTAQSNRVALHSASTETPTLVERLSENA